MGKFIAIKEEDWEKLKIASKHGLHSLPNIPITELSTDESIEERAKEYLDKNCLIGMRFKKKIYEVSSFNLLEFSKIQSLIEQMKAKENRLISLENWIRNKLQEN